MKKTRHTNSKGMAIMTVMVIILVLTVSVFLLARNTQFVTKLSGFFKRSQQLQEEAETGLVLARTDLSRLLSNSQLNDAAVDSFVNLVDEADPLGAAYDQGLYFDFEASMDERLLTPRFVRDNGDIETKIYYFPENPCQPTACSDLNEYDARLPKYFLVVSEATQHSTGEVFTIESRIQIRMENFAEVSLGFHGVGSFPNPNGNFTFYPGVYGRTHMNLPAGKVIFKFPGDLQYNEGYVDDSRNRFWFTDPLTFQNKTPNGQEHPFKIQTRTTGWSVDPSDSTIANQYQIKPHVEFEEGYKDGVKLDEGPGFTVPTSDAYIDKLKTSYGANTISANCATAKGSGTERFVDKCFKLNGEEILEYNCNVNDSGMMGRIDDPKMFWIDPDRNQTTDPQNLKPALDDFVVDNPTTPNYDNYVKDTLGIENTSSASAIDRYKGEWADRLNGTPANALTTTLDSTGIYVCEGSDDSCGCRIHIKGILDGQLTMVSDRVVIEGDLVYQDQSASASDDILGLIARQQVEIPEGIPQGVSVPSRTDSTTEALSADKYSPIGDGDSNTLTPAEAYLGMTNFIPENSGTYEDRDIADEIYAGFANFSDRNSDSTLASDFQAYNAVNSLDIDGHIYSSGPLVIQGIFNPEVNNKGIGIVTCENANCTETKRRDPFDLNDPDKSYLAEQETYYAVDSDGNAILDENNKNMVFTDISDIPSGYSPDPAGSTFSPITNADGYPVKPMYYANGVGPLSPEVFFNTPDYSNADYNSGSNGRGEEIPRSGNTLLSVFGSMNTQFFYTKQGFNFKGYGFKGKIFKNDPRSLYLVPPGFPPTNNTLTEELFRKAYMGRSKLVL